MWGSSGVRKSCIKLSILYPKITKLSFFCTETTFEVSYDYDTQTYRPLYRPLQALLVYLMAFWRPLFSHFHTEPLFPRGIISKNFRVYTWFYLKRRQIHKTLIKTCKSLVISVCPCTHPLTISNLTI